MSLDGSLRSWDEARGFGFIAPRDGGRELFVHVSELPRDGSRPTVGERLRYEVGRGKDGRPQAVRVVREAIGRPPAPPPRAPTRLWTRAYPRRRWIPLWVVVLAAVLALARQHQINEADASRRTARLAAPTAPIGAPNIEFRCDGRTHCSQMTSCAEATFFLKSCPGTQMDGNHDGVPCEQQWCTSPLAR